MSRHWTDETDREADEFFSTLGEAEIRRRQQGNEDALLDLRRQEDALTRDMLRRCQPKRKKTR